MLSKIFALPGFTLHAQYIVNSGHLLIEELPEPLMRQETQAGAGHNHVGHLGGGGTRILGGITDI